MKEQALFTFLICMIITVYAATSGSGGSAKLELLGSGFEIKNNDVNFEELFRNEKYKKIAKDTAVKVFGLYELNENEANEALIEKIESLAYDSKFAKRLLEMRDGFKGPFKAPEVEVMLVFDDGIPKDNAHVCPESNFFNKFLGIRLSDPKKMTGIKNANFTYPFGFGCPVQNGTKERITVNPEVGKKFGIDDLTAPVAAVAKALPSYIVIPNK